eukprot:CAMPEP_0169420076 /NCGR_PEP_ID=MMETSP1017-20121227/65345_1 /TAXON_ID=342587 /ORGANISM="Karlodinium micrum, Strain CCMP2283" /LENGTH=435 /DNA_ID=CAMNT_0009528831 /DNA_START=118 /DNA_END=1425 /DNA_ORIENTATION=-
MRNWLRGTELAVSQSVSQPHVVHSCSRHLIRRNLLAFSAARLQKNACGSRRLQRHCMPPVAVEKLKEVKLKRQQRKRQDPSRKPAKVRNGHALRNGQANFEPRNGHAEPAVSGFFESMPDTHFISAKEAFAAGISRDDFARMDTDSSGSIDSKEFVDAAIRKYTHLHGDNLGFVGEVTPEQWATACNINNVDVFLNAVAEAYAAREKLYSSHLSLVTYLVNKFVQRNGKYARSDERYDDMFSEGQMELWKLTAKWNPEDRDRDFRYHLFYGIQSAVSRIRSDNFLNVPYHVTKEARAVQKARRQIFDESGQDADDRQLAEATGMARSKIAYLDSVWKKAGAAELSDRTWLEGSRRGSYGVRGPAAEMEWGVLQQSLETLLGSLPSIEADLIREKYLGASKNSTKRKEIVPLRFLERFGHLQNERLEEWRKAATNR